MHNIDLQTVEYAQYLKCVLYSANSGICTILTVETLQTPPAVLMSAPVGHDDHYLCRIAQNTEFGDNGVGLSHQTSFNSESLEPFLLTTQINS